MNIKNMIVAVLFFSITFGACTAWSMGHRPRKPDVYLCPMHLTITSDKPGNCSICGMDLVKKDTKAAKAKSTCSCCGMHKQ